MKIYTTSREDYLKAILVLQKKLGSVRSVDLARYLGVTKPSVCRAVNVLTDGGFIYMDRDFILHLTDEGRKIADETYERYCFFAQQLKDAGVDENTANEDACKLEHALSPISFLKLKQRFESKKVCM